MAAKVMSGARALLAQLPPGKTPRVMGIFNNCSWGATLDLTPVYILGNYTPVTLEYTATEPVTITCSGWRVYGHGPTEVGLPFIQELMSTDYLQMAVFDRQQKSGAEPIARFVDVKCTGYSTTMSSRSLEEITLTFVGRLVYTESGKSDERADATQLDSGFPG